MTEIQKYQLDELSVTDILSYLVARVFSMGEYIRRQDKQLTKAKEIIANILTYFPDYKVKTFDDMSLLNALDKAEQFLKEVENA